MNNFQSFLGSISAEICLKMDSFGSISQRIAKRWWLRQIPLPPEAGDEAPRPQLENVQRPTPIEITRLIG